MEIYSNTVPLQKDITNITEHGNIFVILCGLKWAINLGIRRIKIESKSNAICKQLNGESRIKRESIKALIEEYENLKEGFLECSVVYSQTMKSRPHSSLENPKEENKTRQEKPKDELLEDLDKGKVQTILPDYYHAIEKTKEREGDINITEPNPSKLILSNIKIPKEKVMTKEEENT